MDQDGWLFRLDEVTTMPKAPTLFDAVAGFVGPMLAEYARLIEEGEPDMPVVIHIGSYEYKTTLKDIQDLDRAHTAAFEAKQKRAARRARGTLI